MLSIVSQALWAVVALIISRQPIAARIIRRAERTPYFHLPGYMERFWVFNPYGKDAQGNPTPARFGWLPSIRVHHILRADGDRHLHDHPWEARTIILRGAYRERRREYDTFGEGYDTTHTLIPGYTARLRFGEFHSIDQVSGGGVWTLFITYGYRGTWGFLVGDQKVPWREYKAMFPDGPWAEEQAEA